MEPVSPDSEELAAAAHALAHTIEARERVGDRAPVEEVLDDPRFAALYEPSESTGVEHRPGSRCSIVLRLGDERDEVIGRAGHGNGWYVESLRVLGTSATLGDGDRVLVDDAGPEAGLDGPPRDYGFDGFGWDDVVYSRRHLRAISLGVWATDKIRRKKSAPRHAAWIKDPTLRFALRFWDGSRWTRFVVEQATAPEWRGTPGRPLPPS